MATDNPTTNSASLARATYRARLHARTDAEIPYPVEKRCSRCGETKPASAFDFVRYNRDGLRESCKPCGRLKGNERNQKYRAKLTARPDVEIVPPAEKRCPRCDQVKPATEFHATRQSVDGLKVHCRDCRMQTHFTLKQERGRVRQIGARYRERLGLPPNVEREETPDGPILRIPLTQGAFAIIDEADWPKVKDYTWFVSTNGYAITNAPIAMRPVLSLWMHRLIVDAPNNMEVDHRDLDRLNCRRGNLRICTSTENSRNRRIRSDNMGSRFKGVRPLGKTGRWVARIENDHIGVYETEEAAASAYDDAAIERFGEFARLNKPTR